MDYMQLLISFLENENLNSKHKIEGGRGRGKGARRCAEGGGEGGGTNKTPGLLIHSFTNAK